MRVSSFNGMHSVLHTTNTSTESMSALEFLRQAIPDDCTVGDKIDLHQLKLIMIDRIISERLATAKPDLSQADLNGLDLSGKDLRSVTLNNAKLENTNLNKICLSQSYLIKANLQNATLKYAKLTNAVLNQANLANVKLNMATLSHSHFAGANFADADLRNSNLQQTNLRGANLTNADLRGANLEKADINNATLEGAKLQGANLSGVNLASAKLKGADLSGLNLQSSDITSAELTGAKLDGANLSFANLNDVKLKGASLNNTNLIGVELNGADLTGAKLDGAKLSYISLPTWNNDHLDFYLNHIDNHSSLLTTIDSIDKKYNDIKINLVHQLIHSLDKRAKEVSLSSVVEPLLNTLAKAPYNQDQKILNWLNNNILPLYLAKYDATIMPLPTEPLLATLLNCFSNKSELMFSHNSAFIQMISQVMAGNSSYKEHAETLYKSYLQDSRVAPYTEGDFGDYAGQADWSDNEANNFILLSVQQNRPYAMIMSQSQLQQMLDVHVKKESINWHGFYLYQGQDNIGPADYQLDKLFQHHFKIFENSYRFSQQQASFGKLLTSLELGELQSIFQMATTQYFSSIKLIDADSQTKLNAIFSPKWTEYSENGVTFYRLTDEYRQQLLAAYQLTEADATTQSETLLSLAAVFSRYSSSAIFGTETDSPNALRYFAFALMEKAHQLAPQTFSSEEQYQDWSDRLLGYNNAFSCTAVLSSTMVEYIKKHFSITLAGIMPPAWS